MNKQLIVPLAVVLVALVASTVIQGRLADRWPFAEARTEKLGDFTQRLRALPNDPIGNWEGEPVEIDLKEFKASNCDYAISRIYRNQITGAQVSAYLVSGTARHVTIHTPDWCYRGAGFEMQGDPFAHTISAKGVEQADFITTTFRKEDSMGSTQLRIFWGYTEDGNWRGPRYPKPEYAGRPALYKLYLITDVGNASELPENSPAVAFAEEYLPFVNHYLFNQGGSAESPSTSGTTDTPSASQVDITPSDNGEGDGTSSQTGRTSAGETTTGETATDPASQQPDLDADLNF